ncbi:MAG: BREX-3 system P-loop-containing protein BrxF [Methanosarcinales archaeon]|nr:BREX-3 system P-loop-containing protein BrxF [Methanosarcinales archaeon]
MNGLKGVIERAMRGYYKLVLIAEPSGSGKTHLMRSISKREGNPYINLNLELSRKLLDLPVDKRSLELSGCIEEILSAFPGDVIFLDNTELLFAKELDIDPIYLLQSLSRKNTIVASWNGSYDGKTLVYAEPGHPEYKLYKQSDLGAVIYSLSEVGTIK